MLVSLTKEGNDRIVQISGSGLVFRVTHAVLGSGGYEPLDPITPLAIDANLTALIAEEYRTEVPEEATVFETIVVPRGREVTYTTFKGTDITGSFGEAGLIATVIDPGTTDRTIGYQFLLAVAHFGRQVVTDSTKLVLKWPFDYSILPSFPLPSDYWHVSNANYEASAYTPQQSFIGSGGSSYSLSDNEVVFLPFFVGRLGRTVTQLGLRMVNIPTLPAGAKLGIYDTAPPQQRDVYPRNVLASATLVLAAAATRQMVSLAASVFLPNGLYWIAVGKTSANAVTCRASASTGLTLTGERNPLQWNVNAAAGANTRLVLSLANASALPGGAPIGMALSQAVSPQVEIA